MCRKIMVLILSFVMLLTLASCTKKDVKEESKGRVRVYTRDEIMEERIDGIFVKYSDNAFAPVISETPGYQGDDIDIGNIERYIWFLDPMGLMDDALPEVTKDRPLVAIYNADRNMPLEYSLEKYIDKGYTIGTRVYLDESDDMYLSFNEKLSGSSAADVIGEQSDERALIYSISGSENKLPYDNVDLDINMLLGLDRNKRYTIQAFSGTKLRTFQIYSDTRAFQGDSITPITSPYKKTKDGYFIIELPQNIKTGYYYLSGCGFFKYKAD